MFGYIMINKSEMKLKDFDRYQAYYCGLCHTLKSRHGIVGQATLSYDTTFLLMLLTGLYEPKEKLDFKRCMIHPAKKHAVLQNKFTKYTADMNLLLSYYKCEDDWRDEHNYTKLALYKLLHSSFSALQTAYPKKLQKIYQLLNSMKQSEQKRTKTIDEMAGQFGEIMAEIFACYSDEWEEILRGIGFYLGKFIYLLDAYEDIEKDQKKQAYNPLLSHISSKDFEAKCEQMLTMMMAECSRLFELLPILKNVEILRNILYSGVWIKYTKIKQQREQKAQRQKVKNLTEKAKGLTKKNKDLAEKAKDLIEKPKESAEKTKNSTEKAKISKQLEKQVKINE